MLAFPRPELKKLCRPTTKWARWPPLSLSSFVSTQTLSLFVTPPTVTLLNDTMTSLNYVLTYFFSFTARTLEIFVESLLRKACQVTKARNARTLTPAHLKASINSESQFSFLREIVASIPDINTNASDDDPSSTTDQAANNNLVSNARLPYGRKVNVGTSGTRHRRTRVASSRKGGPPASTTTLSQDEDDDADDLDLDLDDEDEDEGSSCDNSNTTIAVPSSSSTSSTTASRQPQEQTQQQQQQQQQQQNKQQQPSQPAMPFTSTMFRSMSCQSTSSTKPTILNKADLVDDDYDNI